MVSIATVTKGYALQGVKPFKENGNVTETYKGPIQVNNGSPITAIIKDIPAEELAKELFFAILGKTLNLPIPRPLLVLTSKEIISAKHAPKLGDFFLLYGSELENVPSLGSQLCDDIGRLSPALIKKIVKELIKRWDGIGQAYSFDTWTANVDRHINNILFEGTDEIWLIDHGKTLDQESSIPKNAQKAKEQNIINKMDLWLINQLEDHDKNKFATSVADLTHHANGLALEMVLKASEISTLIDSDRIDVIMEYLSDRLTVTNEIAKNKSGLPVPALG